MKLSERMRDQTHGATMHQKDDWADKVAQLEAENEKLRKAIGFFCSVIKSGEKWTQHCQDMYDALLKGEQDV